MLGGLSDIQGSPAYHGSTTGRLMADWIYNPLRSADQDLKSGFATMRARSRDLVRNNPYAANYLRYLVSQVLGPVGVGLEGRVMQRSGQKFDSRANAKVEAAFKRWSKKGVCTVDGRSSRCDVEKLVLRTVAQDGEILVRLIRGAPNVFGFAIQVLDIDHLDTDLTAPATATTNEIRMGIEINRWGRPVAYHIFTRHPSETLRDSVRERIRVPAKDMLHVYRPERAGQSRGVTWFAPSVWNLRMLGGYIEAELVAARTGSAKMGFLIPDAESEEDPREAGSSGADQALEIEAEPGTFTKLPVGMTVQDWSPDHPAAAFKDFVKTNLRGFFAGQGVNYNLAANDLEGVNYSSMRGGTIAERDEFKSLQNWFVEAFCEPLFEAWFEFALLSGQLDLPHAEREHWSAHEWMFRGYPWVDPLKDLQAAAMELKLGLNTRTRLAAERGFDFEENLQMLAREAALAKELGVELSTDLKKPAPDKPGSENPDDEEDEEGEDGGQPANGNGRHALSEYVDRVPAFGGNGRSASRW